MFVRLLHLAVIAALVAAAAYVYDIKYETTLRAERVAKLQHDIRAERDATAALRAEWAKLANPARIQKLAQKHLQLKPFQTSQVDSFDNLPMRPPQIVPPDTSDPIGAMIDISDDDLTASTGSIGTASDNDKTEKPQ
jgi:cell division protein FtsL